MAFKRKVPFKSKKYGNKIIERHIGDAIIRFASQLEMYMYDLLQLACRNLRVKADFQYKEVLQEAFEHNMGNGKEKIHSIATIVDFRIQIEDKHGKNRILYVDTKGFKTPDFTIKWKMLKNKYRLDESCLYEYYLPNNKQACDAVINRIAELAR